MAFSQTEPKVLFGTKNSILLHVGDHVNYASADLWVTIREGINNHSDTIAIARDTAFVITYDHADSGCPRFTNENTTSGFCIKEKKAVDLVMSDHRSVQPLDPSDLKVIFKLGEERDTIDMRCQYPKRDGCLISEVLLKDKVLFVDTAAYDYQYEYNESHRSDGQDRIQRAVDTYVIQGWGDDDLIYVDFSFEMEYSRGEMCMKRTGDDPSEGEIWEVFWVSSEGINEVRFLGARNK